MAKSARASRIKKNNQALKKRVFDPVETARNERLSAKLLELAKAPKEREERMEVEQGTADDAKEDAPADDDEVMDHEHEKAASKPPKSKREVKRVQAARAQRIEKKSRKKARNQVRFPTHGSKKKSSKR